MTGTERDTADAFERAPHRTTIGLAVPVTAALVAEPLKGLVDTAFVAPLGVASVAALGVGTTVLPAVLWVFQFTATGAQTEVARADGEGDAARARSITGTALLLAAIGGAVLALCGMLAARPIAHWMEARGTTLDAATTYLRITALGAPAILLTLTASGALRGCRDVRTPLRIAILSNLVNVGLNALLIPGLGPIPAFGIAGAAWATVASQWLACAWSLSAIFARLGRPDRLGLADAGQLLVVGRDMILRTCLLMVFLVATTRTAQQAGDDAGAAHHAIRQVWMFTALALDGFA